MDPTGDNDIPQHQFKQSMIINLFGLMVEPPVPSDAQDVYILVDNVCIAVVMYTCIAMYVCTINQQTSFC